MLGRARAYPVLSIPLLRILYLPLRCREVALLVSSRRLPLREIAPCEMRLRFRAARAQWPTRDSYQATMAHSATVERITHSWRKPVEIILISTLVSGDHLRTFPAGQQYYSASRH
jgi:hypothetical protein